MPTMAVWMRLEMGPVGLAILVIFITATLVAIGRMAEHKTIKA